MKFVVDTNVILENLEALDGFEVVILSHVLRELEKHKSNRTDSELSFKARRATRYIEDHEEDLTIDLNDYVWKSDDKREADYVDNMIIQACREQGYGLITNDTLLTFKAKGYDIPLIKPSAVEEFDNDYTGVHEITPSDEELSALYENIYENKYGLVKNEYLLIKDAEGNAVDKYRWNGEEHVKVKWKKVSSRIMGDVKPRNPRQELLFNMLQDRKMTVKACFGKYGTGKDFCMISHAVSLVEDGTFAKIVFVRNQVPLKDAPESGFRKGDNFDKFIEFAMPLADAVGGVEQLRFMVMKEQVELQDLSRIRGRDLKNSIVYVTEVQNNTKDHLKLLLGRIGEGSELWLNGDLKQVDKDVFKYNSGLVSASTLKGNDLYGQVFLDKTERSKTAELAELIN